MGMDLELIPVEIFPDETDDISITVARIMAGLIVENNDSSKSTVLGLATGNTPLDIYRELIRLHQEEDLDFSRVITFNLDEYWGLRPENVQSYHMYMLENFFNHVNISLENTHIPEGMVPEGKIEEHCDQYEQAIIDAGGIDFQLLGVGRDGHIGFNEPGSSHDSRTRIITLDDITRIDALPDFGEIGYVPTRAITMGVGTILAARQIALIARGDQKQEPIRRAVEEPISIDVAASYLQDHPNAKIYADQAATGGLTRIRTPWLLGQVDWSDEVLRTRAVLSLSETTQKPVTDLELPDFLNHSLQSLVDNHDIYHLPSNSITLLSNKLRTSGQLPKGKKILVFSPHPDDDIISMGATLRKLVENGNEVCVAYMTAGYTAVFDHAVRDFITRRNLFADSLGFEDQQEPIYQRILEHLARKETHTNGMADIPEILDIKRIIREAEAISTCRFVGITNYGFLNLPFYQTGKAQKMPVGEKDVEIVGQTIDNYEPDIIFAAGDMTDPNGTHRMCLNAIYQSLRINGRKMELWSYRGAWQDYHPSEAEVLVLLTEQDVILKRNGIFRHESQKDQPPQPGHGEGEFWQRAERKNAHTAELIRTYGIDLDNHDGVRYVGVEAFKISRFVA